MMPIVLPAADPELDIVLAREVAASPGAVWDAWTKPEHVRNWFAPVPWTIPSCDIELRPGGVFRCVMRSPEGKEYPNVACYLEVVPGRRLVFTDALLPGFRPAREPLYTAIVTFEAHGGGTRYTVTALHASAEARRHHENVGFAAAWGTALDQLRDYARSL
jgi:uncharacterized protein YndB with AHSA1/START domain